MKKMKGDAGYITSRKTKLTIFTLVEFGVVIIFFAGGYIITKSRLNLGTLFAVLSALPASKMLVETIVMLPYKSIDPKIAAEIEDKSPLLTHAYDLVVTSREKAMHIDALAISNRTVFGYANDPKTDLEAAAKHIRNTLADHEITKTTVKVFHEYVPFLSRAEGLNNMIQVSHDDDKELEERIRRIILGLSM